MNSDMPESLEDRIAPASLVDALPPAENSVLPFLGPLSADAANLETPAASQSGLSIADGRTLTDVPASSISPAFVDGFGGVPLDGLDPTLGLRNPLADDAGTVLGGSAILGADSGAGGALSEPLALGRDAGLSALTNVAGLTSPVLLVDVPKIDPAL